MGPIANIGNRTSDRGKCLLDTAPLHMLSALYAIARPSVRPSHELGSQKRLKIKSSNFYHTVAPLL